MQGAHGRGQEPIGHGSNRKYSAPVRLRRLQGDGALQELQAAPKGVQIQTSQMSRNQL